MLRTRNDARLSAPLPHAVPLRPTAARNRAQADSMLRDLAYVLHLTRTVRQSLTRQA